MITLTPSESRQAATGDPFEVWREMDFREQQIESPNGTVWLWDRRWYPLGDDDLHWRHLDSAVEGKLICSYPPGSVVKCIMSSNSTKWASHWYQPCKVLSVTVSQRDGLWGWVYTLRREG